MGRREDLGRHHTIRRTTDTPPNKSNRRMLIFTLAMAFIVYAMIKSGSIGPAAARPVPEDLVLSASEGVPPKPDDLRVVIDLLAQGSWGPELSDQIELLSEAQWRESEQAAKDYVSLLAAGKGPDNASEELLRDLAVYLGETNATGGASDTDLVRYRVALSAASTGRQLPSSAS